MAVKYQILFQDVDGNDCKITFDFADYSGAPIDITASGDPLTISYQGDQDDLFQKVVTSQASIRCIAQPDFVNDTRDIDDQTVKVNIGTPAFKWDGYLITYQRSEEFDSGNYELEMIAKDPYSYLKEETNRLLSNTNIMGKQSFSDIVSAITSLTVQTIIDYQPMNGVTPVTGELFDNVHILVETFMEDGVLPSGTDIIEKICDLFNCTSFAQDGVIYFRQPRKLLDLPVKNIGENGKYPDFLIATAEEVTRTKAYVQLGVKQTYPDDLGGSFIENNFFYFKDPTKPTGQEYRQWQYLTGGDYDNYNVTTPKILRSDFRGITITGLVTDAIAYPNPWTFPDFPKYMVGITDIVPYPTGGLFHLRLKYKYHTYDQTQPVPNIKYAFNVIAVFGDGTMFATSYSGEGGRDKVNGTWVDISATHASGWNVPLIQFPLANGEKETEFELTLDCSNFSDFPYTKGDFNFMVILWPINRAGVNSSYASQFASPEACLPPDITLTEVSIMPDTYKLTDTYPGVYDNPTSKYLHVFSSDETNTRSDKKFKEVADTLEVVAGTIMGTGNTFNNPSATIPWQGLNGTLMLSNGTAISKFRGVIDDKLITLNAKDRMYFLRQPRNKITVDIRSTTLKFSDILSFPGYITGKYVQMEAEYRVADCEHTIIVQELRGKDDPNDIIENYLSSE